MILILEDNTEKLQSIILDYPKDDIYIQRSVDGAMSLMRQLSTDQFDFVLDNELSPGCGTGLEFLEECRYEDWHRWRISSIRCISFSKNACKEMYQFALKHGITWKHEVR